VAFEIACAFRRPGKLPEGRVVAPAEVLGDVEGRDATLVAIEPGRTGRIIARWMHAGSSQTREYAVPTRVETMATPATHWAPVDQNLLVALDAASQIATKEPLTRFALSRIQLRGRAGEVVATDSKRLFIQGGFKFPWADDVLIPKSSVFAAILALHAGSISVGRTATHVWIEAGPWRLALQIDRTGRFPPVTDFVPRKGMASTTVTLDQRDAEHLLAALPGMPGREEDNRPVTIDANGRIVARSRAAEGRLGETVLAGSRMEGKPVRFSCDRDHLAHAIKLGFRQIEVVATDKPLASRNGARTYVWMPLPADTIVGPSPGPAQAPFSPQVPTPEKPRKMKAPQPAARNPGGPAAPQNPPIRSPDSRPRRQRRNSPGRNANGELVEEAGAVRDLLQGLLTRVRGLLGAARKQRKEERLVKSTLKALKKLNHPRG
jgi:hypothetical protein